MLLNKVAILNPLSRRYIFEKNDKGGGQIAPPPPPSFLTVKCYLLQKYIVLLKHAIFFIFVFMSTSRSIYVFYLFFCYQFIFIKIHHISSLKQINLLFVGHFLSKFCLEILLSFCLILC